MPTTKKDPEAVKSTARAGKGAGRDKGTDPAKRAADPAKKAADPAKKAPRPAKKAAAQPRAARAKASSSDDDDDEREPVDRGDEDEDEGRDDGDSSRDDDESEVVEVVGEIVDEPTGGDDEPAEVDLEDDAFIDRARKRTTPPSTRSDTSGEAALSRTDPLQAYLREVQRHPLLTSDEEKALTMHYTKTQDVRTAARLVTANLRLVVKLAYEYRRAYKNIMDLIQEGNIGLMQAVKRYDPYRGVKLSSYAAWWIRAYILRFILNNWRLVKLGTTQAQRKLFFNLNKEKAKLAAMGMDASPGEIARRLSVEEKEVVEMDRRLSSGEASLDAPVGDSDGRAVSRIEMLPSGTSGPDAAFEKSEMGQMVHERLMTFRATLQGKDGVIFDKRMAAEDPLTLQELGNEFGISRERVRQLEARLTTKLRAYLKEELGDAVGTS